MDKQTKKLIQNLSNPDPKVRYDAVLALGKMGDVSLIDDLDRVATLDQNPKVRDLAYKAVRTLTVLRQREQSVAREKLMKAADDDYEWQMLSGEINKQAGTVITEIKWEDEDILSLPPDMDASPVEVEEQPSKKRREKRSKTKATQQQQTRGKVRMSGCFKVFLWAAACVALLGAAVVAFNEIGTPEDAPVNRADTLYKLNEWVQENAETALAYEAQLIAPTLDCKAVKSDDVFEITERPDWAGDLEEYYQDGLGPIFLLLDDAETALEETNQQIEAACGGQEQINNADWVVGDAQAQLADARRALESAVNQLDIEWQKLRPQWPTPAPS